MDVWWFTQEWDIEKLKNRIHGRSKKKKNSPKHLESETSKTEHMKNSDIQLSDSNISDIRYFSFWIGFESLLCRSEILNRIGSDIRMNNHSTRKHDTLRTAQPSSLDAPHTALARTTYNTMYTTRCTHAQHNPRASTHRTPHSHA